MSMSETAQQLARPKKEGSPSSPARCRLEGVDLLEWRIQFSQSITQAITHEMAPLAEALHVQYQEVKALHQKAQASSERLQAEGEAVRVGVKAAITSMQEAVEEVRRKQILSTLMIGFLLGAVSVFACFSWQQTRSGDKRAAERWRTLQRKLEQISPGDRAEIQALSQEE